LPGAHFNRSGNDGTITKFGWKAQNKSLLIFAMEAYNVEMGVTNAGFPNERDTTPSCQLDNLTPEDDFNFNGMPSPSRSPASDYSSDSENFAGFMRFLAPPTPAPDTASIIKGRQAFLNIGCASCHVQKQTTLDGVVFFPFSDFALHAMGKGLADGIVQGSAAGDEFRTAPLWGLGQRTYFLHDGRTSNLVVTIQAHASQGSAANAVIQTFNNLASSVKQDILNFLRAL
jgi:CxxC motif-containing protein (DUF1111 family)